MPLVGQLTGKVQPRYLIAAGAAICAVAMYDMRPIANVERKSLRHAIARPEASRMTARVPVANAHGTVSGTV